MYKVLFDANGGQVGTSEMSVIYGSVFGTLPTPTRDYYTFSGWYKEDGTLVTCLDALTEDLRVIIPNKNSEKYMFFPL